MSGATIKGLWRRVKESIIQVQSAVSVVAFVGVLKA
jgi:hypothetical protein